MATIHTLKTQYSAVMRVDYAAISTADSTLLADLAAKVDASTITLGAATAEVAKLAINTTTVANLSYYFFTGATPRAGGLDYLISPTGGNPNNLNSTYYQSFNMENRFINFAVNLGKGGEGATSFTAAYGALSLSEATTKAYTTIFGFAPAAGKIAELLDAQVPNGLGGTYARSQYFAAIGLDGATGQGTKAAMVGWLMAEAAKANLGAYVTANNAFLADLMDDGAALFNVDLLGAYGVQPAHPAGATIAVTASQSVTLEASDVTLRSTTGSDTVTGTVSNAGQTIATGDGNDTITFTAAVGSLIDGGAGNDTITVAQLNASVPVLGGAANGTINGGAGNDVITVGKAADGAVIDGGAGDDTLIIGMDVEFFSKTVIKNVEHVVFDNAMIQFGGIKTTDMVGLKDVTVHSTDGLRLDDLANGVALNLDAQTGGVVTANYHTELVFVGGHASQTVGVSSVMVNLDGVISPTAKPTDLKVTGNHGPLILNVQSNSALGAVTSEGPGVSGVVHVKGLGVLTAKLVGIQTLDASAAAGVNLSMSGSGAAMTAVLSSGADTLALDLRAAATRTVTLGEGADTFKLFQDGAAAPRFSNLTVEDNKVTTMAVVTDFAKGVDKVDLGVEIATLSKVSSGAATTFEQALINASSAVAANSTGVFEYGGDTYIYRQDATVGVNTGDGLIKLVGVTGLTLATGAATGDIHYG